MRRSGNPMDTPKLTKISNLIAALARSPLEFPAYVRYLPFWGQHPTTSQLPWISFGALRRLERFLQPSHHVFEYGGGGSTLWFARHVGSVLTMESDSAWHGHLIKRIAELRLSNVRCELQPISGDTPQSFTTNAFFNRIKESLWDVVLVDCYCGFSASRYGLTRPFALKLALEHTKVGGLVVLDDSWMFRDLIQPRTGWQIVDYVGPGPCRYGVTSTAVFERTA